MSLPAEIWLLFKPNFGTTTRVRLPVKRQYPFDACTEPQEGRNAAPDGLVNRNDAQYGTAESGSKDLLRSIEYE